MIKSLAEDSRVDFFIGSVHHVHGVPIDFDRAMYEQARCENDEALFGDYFDSMFAMLKDLRPPVVGHFDLIRLFSDLPNQDLKALNSVWAKVVRNLKMINEQNGLLEINSSALRKGLHEPYPSRSVCKV
jgi:histidinol-phosphatase (PHP family)